MLLLTKINSKNTVHATVFLHLTGEVAKLKHSRHKKNTNWQVFGSRAKYKNVLPVQDIRFLQHWGNFYACRRKTLEEIYRFLVEDEHALNTDYKKIRKKHQTHNWSCDV